MMFKKLTGTRFFRFLVVGVCNTAVGMGIMFLAYNLWGLDYWVASALNYIAGSVLSYFLNKFYTFQNKERSARSVLRFTCHIALCYLLAYGPARWFVWLLPGYYLPAARDNAAMVLGAGCFVLLNYWGQKHFVFSEHANPLTEMAGKLTALRKSCSASDVRRALICACGGLLLLLMGFLGLITTLSADDYWYGTFLRDGLLRYFSMVSEHYETFNGRVLVHVLAQITLYFGNWLFAVFHLVVAFGLSYFSVRFLRRTGPREPGDVFLSAALLVAGILSLPNGMMVEGIMWTAAFFNYVFPVLMIAGQIYLLRHLHGQTAWRPALIAGIFYCFLCGATTEQAGAAAVVVAFFCGIESLLARRSVRAGLYGILTLAASGGGLLSIFLSPATMRRFARESQAHSQDRIQSIARMMGVAETYLVEHLPLLILVVLFFLLCGLSLFSVTKRKRYAVAGVAWAAAVALLGFSGGADGATLLVTYVGVFAAALLFLFATNMQEVGYFLLAGVVSGGVILLTNSVAFRTLLPFYLFVLLAMTAVIARFLKEHPGYSLGAALLAAAIGVGSIAPHLGAHLYNRRIEDINFRYALAEKSSGVLYIRFDYDKTHTHTKMQDDGYIYLTYLDYIGVDRASPEVFALSESSYTIYVDGGLSPLPGYLADGEYYLPMRSLVEQWGGEVGYTPTVTTAALDGGTLFLEGGRITYIGPDGIGSPIHAEKKIINARTHLPQQVFTECFGATVTVQENQKVIYVTRGG